MNRNVYYNSDEELLENINKTITVNPNASQRTIAVNCNISLGMANAVLKRFVERGWIMVRNLNSSKLAYALSEEGMRTLAERSKRYIQRTFGLINEYSEAIVANIQKAKDEGKTRVVLVGKSNVKFLIEYACQNCGVEFVVRETLNDEIGVESDLLILIGEFADYNECNFMSVIDIVKKNNL